MSVLDSEIRGDWNNLKGTDYHLVYALWLLLCSDVSGVAFYRGNDLLARPTLPPVFGEISESTPIALLHTSGDRDVWVQLKATTANWTPTALLRTEENLLANFLCNVFQSQREGRQWDVRLVTQGTVQRTEVEEFIADPSQKPMLRKSLDEIVAQTRSRIQSGGDDKLAECLEITLHVLALEILGQLARTEPIHLETLKAEIEREIAYACPDPEAVSQMANTLLGALLSDAAGGPENARIYDAEWLDKAAGQPIKLRGLFDRDAIAACTEAAQRALPDNWDGGKRFAPRPRLENALQQFLAARQTLFVLVGASGAGKSWSIWDWITWTLEGRVRCVIPGSSLDHSRQLEALVAEQMRPYSRTTMPDARFIDRLQAAASVEGQGPFVIIIDNLHPVGAPDVFRRDLAQLVKQCRERGAKLVFVCQRQIWELYHLDAEIPPNEVFSLEPVSQQPRQSYSFLLSELTLEELSEVLKQRLPPQRAERAALQLRVPAFASLRNPYLLERYVEQHSARLGEPNEAPIPVDVDNLLDMRVDGALSHVARELLCDENDVRLTFDSLVEQLWAMRPNGLPGAQATAHLETHLPSQGKSCLDWLRKVGLLTSRGDVRLAEPSIAERLYALRLDVQLRSEQNIIEELRPEEDTGVVSALLRGVVTDPVPCAEMLLARDRERWTKAVADGLAQCSLTKDYRVLALLTVLARRRGEIVVPKAYEALGQLAARDRLAWKWVVQLYLSDRQMESHHGAFALATTMETTPLRVEAAMRLRLSRAAQMNHSLDRDKRERWLQGALDPLHRIEHHAAAEVGKRVIQRYGSLAGQGEEHLEQGFVEMIDTARGLIALSTSASEVERLLSELRSEDAITRYRAARALRPVAFRRPDLIQDALCEAIRQEKDGGVMTRLLWITYRLGETVPDALLDALQASFVVHWREPLRTSGLLLAVLGNVAYQRPDTVFHLLPRKLDAYEPWGQACLSEMLAYAWWRCADYAPEARAHLSVLATPNLAGIPDKFRPFALRGAAIAQLGLMCVGNTSSDELAGRQAPYQNWDLQFLHVQTDEFGKRHASFLLHHPEYERLQSLLLECLHTADHASVHPIEKALYQAQYRCTGLCLEMLIHFATASDDPLPLISALPRDWQALRAAWRLLEAGRTEQAIIDFAQQACAEHANGGTVQALEERESCLAQLALLESEPSSALTAHRAADGSFFKLIGPARRLAQLADSRPDQMLSLLNSSVRTEEDVPTLHHWVEETHSWRGLLIARVYARMFDARPIHPPEARELCEQMLTAVRALPDSSEKQQYEAIYKAIAHWPDKAFQPALTVQTSPSTLQRSHLSAVLLLQQASERSAQGKDPTWLMDVFADRSGWWETNQYQLKDGSLSSGSGWEIYLIYVFPAVRLALAVIGQPYGLIDPAGQLMRERSQVVEVCEEHGWILTEPANWEKHHCERALSAFQEQMQYTPRDERLWAWCGHLLIKLDRLTEAEQALQHCRSMPVCSQGTHADALYNLACVYARTDRESECRSALEACNQLRPLNRKWLIQDPDLAAMHGKPWFEALHGSKLGMVHRLLKWSRKHLENLRAWAARLLANALHNIHPK
jgi:hypothetical protein